MTPNNAPSTARPTSRERRIELLADCYDDPDLFNTVFLQRPDYWDRQREAADSVARFRDTVVYSGNAVGKDYLVAGLILWWLYTRKNSLVVVIGPSQRQLGSVTFKEVRRALKAMPWPTRAKVTTSVSASPQIVDLGDGWMALGYATDSVERASGQHAGQLLVIVEEASGVAPEVWEAIDGLKATKLLAIGNPIRPIGRFVDLIHQAERDERDGVPDAARVNAIQIASTESPHAEWETSPVGLADKAWLESVYRRYGEDSLWCASHVFARIPALEQSALLPEAWLDHAAAVERRTKAPVELRMAIDLGLGVGRDSSVILVRDDLGILEVVASNTMGLAETAAAAARLAGRWGVPQARVTFDSAGIGQDFGNHLIRVGLGGAQGYCGASQPRNVTDFVNVRSEGAWALRNRLDPKWVPDPRRSPGARQEAFQIPSGPWWPRLRTELAALTFDLVDKKTRLVLKEELKARLGQSPDLADALIQSFAC